MGRLDEIQQRIDERMAEIDRRVNADRLAEIERRADARMREAESRMATHTERPSPAEAPSPSVPPSPAPSTSAAVPAAEEIRAALAASPVPGAAVPEMWETSPHELLQLMQYVCSAPHVTSNMRYAETARKLQFSVKADIPSINAFARLEKGSAPTITLLGGAIRLANLAAAAYVGAGAVKERQGGGNPLPEITDALGKLCISGNAAISPEAACGFAEAYNLHLVMAEPALARKAKSFSAGLLIGILAHELGHLALGHCHGLRANLEVSRNQEREADSFASSVISSSPFGDYLVFGMILWEAVWMWVEEATGASASTHPLSKERLADLIRANPSVASELGISAEGLPS